MSEKIRREVPTWLTKEFIEKALEDGKRYSVKVENLEINMPVEIGDNYASDIFGAKIAFKKSNDLKNVYKTSLIIKAPLLGKLSDTLEEFGHMKNEIKIYNEISPKFNEIFGIDDDGDEDSDLQLLAKSYFSTEKNVVILEDLKIKGYRVADRLNQLDLDHCVVALKTLSKFHAGSVLINEKESGFIEQNFGKDKIFSNVTESKNNSVKDYVVTSYKIFSKELKNLPELEKYSNWFEENAENIWNQLVEAVKRNENEFNVLNHGDFWTANMLFKYDENNIPIKAKPIDMQTPRYTSPAIDFMHFIETSAQENVRNENFDELINTYIGELNSYLERYGSVKRLEKCEFIISLNQRSIYRLYASVSGLPFIIADPKSIEIADFRDSSLTDLSDTEKHPIKNYYKNKKYINIISKRLGEFEKMGYIAVE